MGLIPLPGALGAAQHDDDETRWRNRLSTRQRLARQAADGDHLGSSEAGLFENARCSVRVTLPLWHLSQLQQGKQGEQYRGSEVCERRSEAHHFDHQSAPSTACPYRTWHSVWRYSARASEISERRQGRQKVVAAGIDFAAGSWQLHMAWLGCWLLSRTRGSDWPQPLPSLFLSSAPLAPRSTVHRGGWGSMLCAVGKDGARSGNDRKRSLGGAGPLLLCHVDAPARQLIYGVGLSRKSDWPACSTSGDDYMTFRRRVPAAD